ncbi:MAG: hypothetical protein J3Q66DRAFT_441986 [Benniella sp.]|nr:MAG: hypothetical protein J3Q66DRAFT_441986 [Benniella sp.]
MVSSRMGDMIYQGNKLLEKRWKKFPTLLPTLLLHRSGDPIASYQATTTLSNKLLKLQPISFVFKSWKGSKHDPHWDIDANAVRNEWIHDIRRHFDKVPLDDSLVHSDSFKSVRSREKNEISGKAGSRDKTWLAGEIMERTNKPEGIQDLKDLLRQQQLKQEKARVKRIEYELDTHEGEKAIPTTADRSFTNVAGSTSSLGAGTDASQAVTKPPESQVPEKATTGSVVDNPPETIPPSKVEEVEEIQEADKKLTVAQASISDHLGTADQTVVSNTNADAVCQPNMAEKSAVTDTQESIQQVHILSPQAENSEMVERAV